MPTVTHQGNTESVRYIHDGEDDINQLDCINKNHVSHVIREYYIPRKSPCDVYVIYNAVINHNMVQYK